MGWNYSQLTTHSLNLPVWLYGRYEHVLDTPRASPPLVQLGYHKPCRTNKTRRTGLQAHGMAWQSSWYWVWS
jgi:hypothetical protein